ncbi:hypothetical protein H0O02_02965, partial [Candidatus Micrarchaeota archaeon]|nr:hypothetical protein [Candidatus Micrarchaeota archaeon]
MVLTSAIEKGVELPKGVYDDARVAIATRDPEKWKEAAAEAAPVVEKEMEKKKEKELKSLSEEKLG